MSLTLARRVRLNWARYTLVMAKQTPHVHNDPYILAEELEAAGVLRAASLPKLNSFACACCHLIWDELPPIAQLGLEVAERYVNGNATTKELIDERVKLWQDLGDESWEFESKKNNAYRAVLCSLHMRDPEDSIDADYDVVTYVMEVCNKVKKMPKQTHYELMHNVFGSPPDSA